MKKDKNNRNVGMFKGAPVESFLKAKQLRENMTDAESKLWDLLKNKNLNQLKFRRQHPIGLYIVDFYCHSLKLIIEVDGEYHQNSDQTELDMQRTLNLEEMGLTVIRFKNQEIFENIEKVIERILAAKA